MSVRKSSHGTIFLIVSSGSPRALIASSLRSTSKKPFCPITRPLHPPMTAHGHRVRFVATWREEFFEVPSSFLGSVTLRGGLFSPIPSIQELGGLSMTIDSVTPTEQTMAITDVFATNDVRTLVAKHIGVSVDRVTDEAHFTNDLGADWLDRLELMMVVEDQFAGVEITGADVDRIKVVGDLIRHIETVDKERRRRGAAPVVRKLFGPRLAHTVKLTKQ